MNVLEKLLERHPFLCASVFVCTLCILAGIMITMSALSHGNADAVGGGFALIAAPSIMTLVGIGMSQIQ